MDVQLINVETAEIIAAETGKGTSRAVIHYDAREALASKDAELWVSEALRSASDDVAGKIAKMLMKVLRRKVFCPILGILFLFISSAIGASSESMIHGKWKDTKGKVLEFIKDGTLIVENQGAKYRIIDKERMEIEVGMLGLFSDLGPRPILKFTVTKDELTLTPLAKPNETEKYRRVRIDASGKDAVEYYNSGMKLALKSDYQEATKDFSKAIEIDPSYIDAYTFRASAYSRLGNYRDALRDYSKVIELTPNSQVGYYYRGLIYILIKDYSAAINDFKKAIEIDPKNPGAPHYHLARIYSLQNNTQLACEHLKKAIAFWPKNSKVESTKDFQKHFENIHNAPCFRDIMKNR